MAATSYPQVLAFSNSRFSFLVLSSKPNPGDISDSYEAKYEVSGGSGEVSGEVK